MASAQLQHYLILIYAGKTNEAQATVMGKGVPKVLDYNCFFAVFRYDKGRIQLNINSFIFLKQVTYLKKAKN